MAWRVGLRVVGRPLVGLRTAGAAASVRGVAAARPSVELRPLIAAMVGSLANVAGLVSVPDDEIVVDDGQIGEGYGRATAAADEATRLLEPAA